MLSVQQPLVLSAEQIHLVVRGQRTALLVPRREARGDRPPYRAGSAIALQVGATRPARARVVVSRITDIALGELDDDQARDLGRRDLDDLMAAWVAERGQWNENARAWLLRVAPDNSARRRLLHRDSTHGYTDDPRLSLPEEPEAVGEHELERASIAAARTEQQRFEQTLAENAQLPDGERLARAIADARTRGVDIEHALWLLRKRLVAIERLVYRPADRTDAVS
jgi:hypothetical protein